MSRHLFAIQDEIAQAIATALQDEDGGKEGRAFARTLSPLPAYEAFLRGRHLLFKFTPDGWARAKVWLDQAIALDPEFADPHMVLALGYILIGFNGIQPFRDITPAMRAAAHRALDAQPGRSAAAVPPRLRRRRARLRLERSGRAIPSERWTRRTCRPTRAGPTRACTSARWAASRESSAEMGRAVEQDPLNAVWRAILVGAPHECRPRSTARSKRRRRRSSWTRVTSRRTCILGEVYLAGGRLEGCDRRVREGGAPHRAVARDPTRAAGRLALSPRGQGAFGRAREADGRRPASPMGTRALITCSRRSIDAAADWFEKDDRGSATRSPSRYTRSPIVKPLLRERALAEAGGGDESPAA